MSSPQETVFQINRVISHMVEVGLANDQNLAFQRHVGGRRSEVTFTGAEYQSFGLKDWTYNDIYDALKRERAYTVLLQDGALLQLSYQFVDSDLEKHRLAFWPSPYLEQFQNEPEIYLEDRIYAEIVSRRVVPFPLRFDHDARTNSYRDVRHPISHLTLGQYENCRIPLSTPLPPAHFTDFVLRNFYHTAYSDYTASLPRFTSSYNECISANERNLIHIAIPRAIYHDGSL